MKPLIAWLLLGAAAGAFVLHPEWDLQASGLFYQHDRFVLADSGWAKLISKANHDISIMLGCLFAVALLITAMRRRALLGLRWPAYGFLLTSLIVGPGLVTNTLLKDHWGRARPAQVQEFGGTQRFTPAAIITDQCDRNCSFVCGDAAFVFWVVAFAYVAPPPRRRMIAIAALALGTADGALRMAQGGHFLSDVLFAAWVMMFTTAVCYGAWFLGRVKVLP